MLSLLLIGAGVWEVYGQPTATVTYSRTNFCESEKDGSGAVNVKVTLTLNGTGNYNYEYEFDPFGTGNPQSSGDISYTGNASGETIIDIPLSFFANGDFKLIYVKDGGTDIEPIENTVQEITIDPKPLPTIHDPIRTCDLDIYLRATKEFDSSITSWWLENGVADGALRNEASLEPIFSAAAPGDYILHFMEKQGACETSISRSIKVEDKPSPSGRTLSKDLVICSNKMATIELELNGSFPITVTYTDGEVTFQEAVVKQIETRKLIESETYKLFKLTDKDGCETNFNTDINIQVDLTPVANAGFFDQPVCGTEVQLGASLSNGNNGSWAVIDDNDGSGLTLEDINNPQSKASLNYAAQYVNESYTLRWTEVNGSNAACVDYDDVIVEFDKEPMNVSLGNDTTVYLDKEVAFMATGLDDMPLSWYLPDGVAIDDYGVPNLLVSNLSQGDNKIICTIENGVCEAVQAEKLIRVNEIYQTTGFSPNGDGVNDLFVIGGAKNVINNKLVVFDVTGKVVYEVNDFMRNDDTQEGWNGLQNDGELKDGTYYYIFTGDEIEPIKNYLIIKGSTK